MSDDSGSFKGIPRVLTTIGAHDLHQLCPTKCGFLRKQGKIERRLSQLGKVGEQFKWRQMYVIIAKGCMYIYDNEDSTSPKTAFTLYGYNRVARYESTNTRNAFRIEMPMEESVRYRTFATHSDEERKEWICAIYETMMYANSRVCQSVKILQTYDYDELELPIFVTNNTKRISGKASDLEIVDDIDDNDYGGYDKIDEKNVIHKIKRKELPPLPSEPAWSRPDKKLIVKSQSFPTPPSPKNKEMEKPRLYHNQQESKKPPIAPKPKNLEELEAYEDTSHLSKRTALSPADYEFDESDTAKAKRYLIGQSEGTFLVRPSKTDDAKVLMAVCENGETKQYRIHQSGNKFTLDHNKKFLSIKETLEYYRKNKLPNIQTILTEGYGYK